MAQTKSACQVAAGSAELLQQHLEWHRQSQHARRQQEGAEILQQHLEWHKQSQHARRQQEGAELLQQHLVRHRQSLCAYKYFFAKLMNLDIAVEYTSKQNKKNATIVITLTSSISTSCSGSVLSSDILNVSIGTFS